MALSSTQFIAEAKVASEMIVGAPYGSTQYATILGTGLFCVFFFGKIIATYIGGSKRGFITAGAALSAPLIAGFFAFVLASLYIPRWVPSESIQFIVETGFATIISLLTLILITPLLLGIGILRSLLILAVTGFVSFCFIYLAEGVFFNLNRGAVSVKMRGIIKHLQ